MNERNRGNPPKTNRARQLRQADNDAERALWYELRARRLSGHKFVRQLPIGPYFADFACREKKLVVELDGSQHADSSYDRQRDAFMASKGWSVVRFWSHEVLGARKNVLETIVAILDGKLLESVDADDLRFIPGRTGEQYSR